MAEEPYVCGECGGSGEEDDYCYGFAQSHFPLSSDGGGGVILFSFLFKVVVGFSLREAY